MHVSGACGYEVIAQSGVDRIHRLKLANVNSQLPRLVLLSHGLDESKI